MVQYEGEEYGIQTEENLADQRWKIYEDEVSQIIWQRVDREISNHIC